MIKLVLSLILLLGIGVSSGFWYNGNPAQGPFPVMYGNEFNTYGVGYYSYFFPYNGYVNYYAYDSRHMYYLNGHGYNYGYP